MELANISKFIYINKYRSLQSRTLGDYIFINNILHLRNQLFSYPALTSFQACFDPSDFPFHPIYSSLHQRQLPGHTLIYNPSFHFLNLNLPSRTAESTFESKYMTEQVPVILLCATTRWVGKTGALSKNFSKSIQNQ